MVSVKLASLFVFAAFVAGSFVASPELRAFAANTVGSSDIIDGSILSVDIKNGEVKTADLGGSSVTSAKIKDGEVKVVDIGQDAVGGSEVIGVSKLLFAKCSYVDNTMRPPRYIDPDPAVLFQPSFYNLKCPVPGAASGDDVVVTRRTKENCFDINGAYADNGAVHIKGANDCAVNAALGPTDFYIIVFKSDQVVAGQKLG